MEGGEECCGSVAVWRTVEKLLPVKCGTPHHKLHPHNDCSRTGRLWSSCYDHDHDHDYDCVSVWLSLRLRLLGQVRVDHWLDSVLYRQTRKSCASRNSCSKFEIKSKRRLVTKFKQFRHCFSCGVDGVGVVVVVCVRACVCV